MNNQQITPLGIGMLVEGFVIGLIVAAVLEGRRKLRRKLGKEPEA